MAQHPVVFKAGNVGASEFGTIGAPFSFDFFVAHSRMPHVRQKNGTPIAEAAVAQKIRHRPFHLHGCKLLLVCLEKLFVLPLRGGCMRKAPQ